MSTLLVGQQAQSFNLSEDTTAYNPSSSVSILVGDTSSPDTPIQPLAGFMLSGGRTYWFQTSDGSTQPVLFLKGLTGTLPSPAQIAAQLTQSGLAAAIAADIAGSALPENIGTSVAGSALPTLIATDVAGSALPGNTAAQIATTGVPLLSGYNSLGSSGAGTGVAANGNLAIGPFPVTQIGFEMVVTPNFTVAIGATPYMLVVVKWNDSATGLVVDKFAYTLVVAGNAGSKTTPHRIRGPSRADRVSVTFYNLDAAQSMTVFYTLVQTSRVVQSEQIDLMVDWKEDGPGLGTVNFASRVMQDGKLLGQQNNSSLAAAGTDTVLFPPHNGPAFFDMTETGVAGSNIAVTLSAVPTSIYGSAADLINDIMGTGNPNKLSYSLVLPAGPTQLSVKNNGSVAANYSATLIAA